MNGLDRDPMPIHEYSIETLYHIKCGECHNRWSYAHTPDLTFITNHDPRTFAKPFVIPINPKNIKALKSYSKNISVNIDNSKGILTIGINFLLVNLSTRKPDKMSDNIDVIE